MTAKAGVHTSVRILNHSVLSVIAVGSVLSVLGSSVYVSKSFGDFVSSSPIASSSPVADADVEGGGGGGGGALFRAPKDNKRNEWGWDSEHGWSLDVTEKTYENGWHWLWTPKGWVWSEDRHTAAPELRQYVSPAAKDTEVLLLKNETPSCFAVNGAWVSERSLCAADQMAAAAKADTKHLPAFYQDILRRAAPLSQSGEKAVRTALQNRFDVLLTSTAKTGVVRATSNVITRLQILKESTAVTETEKQFFIEKIVGLQKTLAETTSADKTTLSRLAKNVQALTADIASYVDQHAIAIPVQDAPSAASILQTAKRITTALPSAFDALEKAGHSTGDLRVMHASVLHSLADVSTRCSLGQDCSRVADVIDQLQLTITKLRERVNAIGNSTLNIEVERSFERNFR